MKLLDLDPIWIDRPWHNRFKVGIRFKCIHCDQLISIYFKNPLDGGPPNHLEPRWLAIGDTFDRLSLVPSIDWAGHMHVNLNHGVLTPA